jgi:Asp-tRNA(Asn)/Glu-tRNA(Gln) amidotransferase A subunit family amidase
MTPTTIAAARAALQNGETTSLALVQHALEQAKQFTDCNLFAHLDARRALELAQQCDATPSQGALHGIPITVKDLYNVSNMPTKGGTHAALPPEFLNPQTTAQAVSHLEAAGAIVLGKVNMHEIALGSTPNRWLKQWQRCRRGGWGGAGQPRLGHGRFGADSCQFLWLGWL